MILADSSAWIEFLRATGSPEHLRVRRAIDDGEFSLWYLQDGRVAGALSVGRSDDLEHARRLLTNHTDVSAHTAELADVNTDLSGL